MKKTTSEATAADKYAGMRLRQLRTLKDMSQERLAEALGITFQQVQKYENAQNRISVSRLNDIAKILGIGADYFFLNTSDPMPGFGEDKQEPLEGMPGNMPQETANDLVYEAELLSRRETLDLVRAWYRIADTKQRRKILDMIRSLETDEDKKSEQAAAG